MGGADLNEGHCWLPDIHRVNVAKGAVVSPNHDDDSCAEPKIYTLFWYLDPYKVSEGPSTMPRKSVFPHGHRDQ